MPTSQNQIDFISEQLYFVPDFYAKKMFGEYGLYSGYDTEKKFFALVCNSKLFLRATDSLKLILPDDGQRAYETATDGYYHVDENYLEDE
jgi:TfoX/Sxy family transcriptional regulator of competence genes